MSVLIAKINALEILDSRGMPTVECAVSLTDGSIGVASVPSGASVGLLEAVELRDCDGARYGGRGVLRAIANIDNKIAPVLLGMDPFDQGMIDQKMIQLDGSKQKSSLGANAILAVSMAVARAAAIASKVPFYSYLGGDKATVMPMPMMNILNGGAHANNLVDIQEIMIIPYSAKSYLDAVRMSVKVYHALGGLLNKQGHITAVGDEGGFAPNFSSNKQAMQAVLQAIELAGYVPGKDIVMALDVAASELYKDGHYVLASENKKYNMQQWVDEIATWLKAFPIVSIEDAMDQSDWLGWSFLTQKLGSKVQLVGDDIFVTHVDLLKKAIKAKAANAILIKPNQVGTLTETFTTIGYAKQSNYNLVLSHRSGETEDSAIADIAVATAAGQIKAGAPCRVDRVAKYNQLLRIEAELGDRAIFMTGQSLYYL